MSWGGGMGGGMGGAPGGFGRPAAPGLPFAGIPSELQAGVDRLVASEPEAIWLGVYATAQPM